MLRLRQKIYNILQIPLFSHITYTSHTSSVGPLRKLLHLRSYLVWHNFQSILTPGHTQDNPVRPCCCLLCNEPTENSHTSLQFSLDLFFLLIVLVFQPTNRRFWFNCDPLWGCRGQNRATRRVNMHLKCNSWTQSWLWAITGTNKRFIIQHDNKYIMYIFRHSTQHY